MSYVELDAYTTLDKIDRKLPSRNQQLRELRTLSGGMKQPIEIPYAGKFRRGISTDDLTSMGIDAPGDGTHITAILRDEGSDGRCHAVVTGEKSFTIHDLASRESIASLERHLKLHSDSK